MSGFFENVVFPDDDGGIHSIRADVYRKVHTTEAGLQVHANGLVEANQAALTVLLKMLKDRRSELNRLGRGDGHLKSIVLSQLDPKQVDQDSYCLAFAFAYHRALHIDWDDLVPHSSTVKMPRITKLLALTGSLDATGVVQPVSGIAQKISALEKFALKINARDKVFVLPKANVDEKRDDLASDLKRLEAEGWNVVAASHMDDLVSLYTSVGIPDDTKKESKGLVDGFWRPIIVGLVFGTIAMVGAAYWSLNSPAALQGLAAEPEVVQSSETRYYQKNTQSSRELTDTPISAVGPYQGRSDLQFPAYKIDGRQEKVIISADDIDLINWAINHKLDIRSALSCASGYSIAPDEVVTFKDGSYCVIDLCKKNYTEHY